MGTSSRKQTQNHPGAYIRKHIIPSALSVKDAAKRLGIGRPTLSNLLNGNSSLSTDMALRLEKAFGADREKLLKLQAEFEHGEQSADKKTMAVSAYVPAFLSIKARQIQQWAENDIKSRQYLPVLLRKLVNSTGHELRHVDFPGYDNAERKGSDGLTEAGAATPWIPRGKSYWEFGTTANPRSKAEKDYAARLTSVPGAERADSTFIFVTPRNWPGKTEWVKEKSAAGDWKGVKVYDASDLEQWLEQSAPAQIWLAERLGLTTRGFETLDHCWQRWAMASEPNLSPKIFAPSIAAYRGAFKAWLGRGSDRPFIIAADSRDEALAFLACLFQDSDIAASSRDLATVFESAETLRNLAASSAAFIPIVTTDEAERELAPVYRRLHSIAIRPRNAVNSEPDIALDLLGHEAFEKALASMGFDSHGAERLARESGRSPTILRRRLSRIDTIKAPHWARDAGSARALIPMTLIGAWHTESKADCEILSVLAGCAYPDIEAGITRLLQFDDCPVWSAGRYRGVASKIDALFAINRSVTEKDLKDFFLLAEYVLSESDPALELPKDQREFAGLYGKVRDHSAALRTGVCETLVILSVNGNNLFRDRLGMDVEAMASLLIRQLLTPLTLEKLLSHDRDLPRYAEAAPDEFLTLLEADLKQPQPAVLGLLEPAGTGVFSGCPRTGLLWALECLAWNPRNLPRVSAILAQLSRTKIDDNWANKPIASLQAIFRSWLPQTAASLEERWKALETLTKRFPDIGWQICIEQFAGGPRTGFYSYRPRWRSDASGVGQRVTYGEINGFRRKALDLALAWPKHEATTLGDMIERLTDMAGEDQTRVWDLIDGWVQNETDENAKASLRERVRRFAFTRRARRRGLKEETRDRAREAYAKLQPRDPVIRHGWLFAKQWVEESADEIEDENYDFTQRTERIDKLRLEAMNEIWAERGFDGLVMLLSGSGAPYVVGRYAALCMPSGADLADFLKRCLSVKSEQQSNIDGFMQGVLAAIDAQARDAVLSSIAESADMDGIVRLFRCAPFNDETWRLLEQYGTEIRARYWREVFPYWNRHSPSELNEVIDRLLEADRPRAAFHVVHMDWTEIETSRLKRLLLAVATTNSEPKGHFNIDAHDISSALQSLDGRAGVTTQEMAQLEFLFISALDHSEHGVPNLERQISASPAMFVQAVALAYKRRSGSEDPPELRIEDPERRAAVAGAAYRLLDQIKRIPGTDADGKVNAEALAAWLDEARRLFVQYGRTTVGDHCIGQLLSTAPEEESGVWPCIPVCEAMENIASQEIAEGFRIAVHNSRGVHWRDEGGTQERELAAKYRRLAQRLAFDFPYVSSVLESIASSYDREAEWQDSRSRVDKRLEN